MDITYEVVTPQTLLTYVIKALTYGQEIDLENAIMTSAESIIKHFNQELYNSITKFPEQVTDFNSFLEKTTIVDRIALVAGLYHVTYGDEYITETRCTKCNTLNSSVVSLTKFSKANFYKGQPLEFLDLTIEEKLKISNVIFKLKVPTLKKEDLIAGENLIEIPPQIQNILLYTEEIIDGEVKFNLDSVVDIVALIRSLPPRDIRQLRKSIENNFTKYNFETKYKVKCSNCGNIYLQTLDFVEQFLRKVVEA